MVLLGMPESGLRNQTGWGRGACETVHQRIWLAKDLDTVSMLLGLSACRKRDQMEREVAADVAKSSEAESYTC